MGYQHIPLTGNSQTRLLLLHPTREKSSPLSGTLAVCDIPVSSQCPLQTPRKYQALSYVWGPPSAVHFINIASSVLPITANCDAALRQLRHTSDDRILWVDSICIDQTPGGTKERNLQVAMMGDIYERAHNVLIWLGEGDEGAEALLLHLKRMYTLRDDIWEDTRSTICSAFVKKCDSRWKVSIRPAVQDVIESVLSLPWFERMWTLQELLLSTHASIMCGNRTVTWDAFCKGFELTEAGFPLSSKGVINFANCYHAYSTFEEMVESAGDQANEPGTLASIVNHARVRQATDPKDKIFALYGLSQKLGKPIKKPDYFQSISDIYTQATVDIIHYDNSLWPLDNTWSENRRDDLPSWVPDWSDDYRWFNDQFSEFGGIPLNPTENEDPPTSDISLKTQTRLVITPLGFKGLVLSGKSIGVIHQVSNGQGRAAMQQQVTVTLKQSPEYCLAMRKYGAMQIRFFRSVYSFICERDDESETRFHTLSRILAIYGRQPFNPTFEAGSRALKFFFKAAESPLYSANLLAIAKEKLTKAVDSNQNHSMIHQILEFDARMVLDVLLSPLDCGAEYRLGRTSRDPDYKLVGAIAQAAGFYRLIRGLAIDKSIFSTDSGMIGYANGDLCRGDILVKFDAGPSIYALHSEGQAHRLHSVATVQWPAGTDEEFDAISSTEFTII